MRVHPNRGRHLAITPCCDGAKVEASEVSDGKAKATARAVFGELKSAAEKRVKGSEPLFRFRHLHTPDFEVQKLRNVAVKYQFKPDDDLVLVYRTRYEADFE